MKLTRLVAADLLNVARDPMLGLASIASLLPVILLGVGGQALDEFGEAWGVAEATRMVLPVVLLLPALLIGWVTGFLFLEDRDEGTLLAVDVTPIGRDGYVAYRLAVAAGVTMAVTLIGLPLVHPVGPELALAAALLVGLATAQAALVLPAVARNKVEGLALGKLTSVAAFAPLLVALPQPWRSVSGGLIPTYWLGEVIGPAADAGSFALVMAMAVTVNVAALAGLLMLLRRRAG